MLKLPATFRACFSLHRKKAKKEEAEVDGLTNAELVRFDFATIKFATANFSISNQIGDGKFGVVYKGTLKSRKQITIKRLGRNIDDPEIFMNWFSIVARLQHPNVVKHLGFCSQEKIYMLVYEFMPNVSLELFLRDPSKSVEIKWETWYKIILGIAKGLEYLHQAGVLHAGLKTSNVLLDDDMNPKIVDYAISWFYQKSTQLGNHWSPISNGSYAYAPQTYCSTGEYTTKSDVYCFGVLVLEVLSNLSVGESYQSRYNFHPRVKKICEEGRLAEFIKPEIRVRCPEADVITCILIGIKCVAPRNTTDMTEVIRLLTSEDASRLLRHL